MNYVERQTIVGAVRMKTGTMMMYSELYPSPVEWNAVSL
jgi:hypothetical protein